MIDLVIWGAGQHAKVAAEVARAGNVFNIVGFIDDVNPERKGSEYFGAQVLGAIDELSLLKNRGVEHVFVSIGANHVRARCYDYALDLGFTPATIVHSFSSIASDCVIGSGTIIKAGVVIEPGVRIGKGVILGSNTSIGHGCSVEDFARISLGSTLSGEVSVECLARLGPGCTILNSVNVGRDALVGAGSVLLTSLPAGKVAVGSPARIIRDVNSDDF